MKNLRAYLRAVPGMPIETQRWMAKDAQVTVVYEHGEYGRKVDVRQGYVRAITPGCEAWVPRLDCLVLPKNERGKVRATTDLAAVIADILGRGGIIVDGSTGVTSRDGQRWKERVEWAMKQVGAGRMSRAKAKRLGAKGGAVIKARAIATLWKSPMKRAEHERWSAVWRDRRYSNDQERADAINVPELKGRKHLCRRIFGRIDPTAQFTGGRPRKR